MTNIFNVITLKVVVIIRFLNRKCSILLLFGRKMKGENLMYELVQSFIMLQLKYGLNSAYLFAIFAFNLFSMSSLTL